MIPEQFAMRRRMMGESGLLVPANVLYDSSYGDIIINQNIPITGGWGVGNFYYDNGSITFENIAGQMLPKAIKMTSAPSSIPPYKIQLLGTLNKIDLTPYSYINITYKNTKISGTNGCSMDITDDYNCCETDPNLFISGTGAVNVLTTQSLNIMTLTGRYYIVLVCANLRNGYFYKVELT